MGLLNIVILVIIVILIRHFRWKRNLNNAEATSVTKPEDIFTYRGKNYDRKTYINNLVWDYQDDRYSGHKLRRKLDRYETKSKLSIFDQMDIKAHRIALGMERPLVRFEKEVPKPFQNNKPMEFSESAESAKVSVQSGMISCPKCGKRQMENMSKCYNCGLSFIKENEDIST